MLPHSAEIPTGKGEENNEHELLQNKFCLFVLFLAFAAPLVCHHKRERWLKRHLNVCLFVFLARPIMTM